MPDCEVCGEPAQELLVNFNNLSEYKWLCLCHQDHWLYKPGWYRAGNEVKQVVLMSDAKDRIEAQRRIPN